MAVQHLTIGRGTLYIAPWTGDGGVTPPTGGDYASMGNCTEVAFELTEETLEHYDYTAGLKSLDEEVSLQTNYQGSFVADHITTENLTKFIRGTVSGTDIRAMTALETRYALKFAQNNPKGPNRIFNFHKVKLTPNGTLGLIADEWQKMSFNFKGLKDEVNNPTSPYFTINDTSTTTTTTTTTTTI